MTTGPKLVAQEPESGVVGLDHRGLDEPPFAVVGAAAGDDLGAGLCLRDRVAVAGECRCVDDGAHEVGEVADVAHSDAADLALERLAYVTPQVRRDVEPRRRGALLTLVLERSPHDCRCDRGGIGRRMRQDEVLAAGLADDAWVVAVATDVAADRAPDRVEDARRAGEVDTCQLRARERGGAHLGPGAEDEVDHAGRQPRLLEDPHLVAAEQPGALGRQASRRPCCPSARAMSSGWRRSLS